MSNDVFADGREVACKAADGKSICAFPDVCLTPPENPATPPGVPVPYPNTGFATDTTEGSRTVKISEKEIVLKNKSYFKTSTGDEAGCAAKKGVITSTNKGKVFFIAWSSDVKVEGENVPRHLDMTTHNHASPMANEGAPMLYVDTLTMEQLQKCTEQKKECDDACEKLPIVMGSKPKGSRGRLEFRGVRAPTSPRITTRNGKKSVSIPDEHEIGEMGRACKPGDECYNCRRCTLVAKSDDKTSCCEQRSTGHHLIPDHSVSNLRGYSHASYDAAPCICVKGTNQSDGLHGVFHGLQDTWERRMIRQKKPLTYAKIRNRALAVHKRVFKKANCDYKCIGHQLDEFYKPFLGKKGENAELSGLEPQSEATLRSTAKTMMDRLSRMRRL